MCQINVPTPRLLIFEFFPKPFPNVYLDPRLFNIILNIFHLSERNWRFQYSYSNIKISVIKYEKNLWKKSIYW